MGSQTTDNDASSAEHITQTHASRTQTYTHTVFLNGSFFQSSPVYNGLKIITWEFLWYMQILPPPRHPPCLYQRSADADIRGRRFSCRRSADPPNKHICGCRPSADLKPRVLFAGPTSNESANVPVLSNLKTDPYLNTAVGYVRKPVWLCGALGIVYWIECNTTLLADADGPQTWVAITVAGADCPRTWCLRMRLSADVKFMDPHTSGLFIWSDTIDI